LIRFNLACLVASLALESPKQATATISLAVRTHGIAIRFLDFIAHRPDEKLFPHFGEAGTAAISGRDCL
jgi:hypothetical protein